MGHVSRSLEQVRSEQCSYVRKSARQKGQQGQAPDADVLLAHLRKECQCQKRSKEERKPSRIPLQTKLCCKITLCRLDIIEVKIGIL